MGKSELNARVGIGYDVHILKEGRKLILGGVEIDYYKGLEGHSDADVLIHAIMDAILGAAGMGDIGTYFPDTDNRYLGASSLKLLAKVMEIIGREKKEIVNVDCIIIAQKPLLSPHIGRMKQKLSGILKIREKQIGIKATTTEKLGFTGREEGIAAQCVVLLK